MASVSIDASQVIRRLKRLETSVTKNGRATVGQVARYARDRIYQTMPEDTGDSKQSIITVTRKQQKGAYQALITQAYIPHPEKPPYDGMAFNLPLFMFLVEDDRWRTGDVMTMRQVPTEAFEKFKQKVELMLVTAVK